MAFTTEELQGLGLTEEQVKEVFALHGKDLNAIKSDLETATQERDSLKNQLQNTEAQLKTNKVNAINLALKDTTAHNPSTLMKFIDVDAIELDENGKPQLDDVINGLKESDPYLFQAEEDGKPNPNIVAFGNPTATDTAPDASAQALGLTE